MLNVQADIQQYSYHCIFVIGFFIEAFNIDNNKARVFWGDESHQAVLKAQIKTEDEQIEYATIESVK